MGLGSERERERGCSQDKTEKEKGRKERKERRKEKKEEKNEEVGRAWPRRWWHSAGRRRPAAWPKGGRWPEPKGWRIMVVVMVVVMNHGYSGGECGGD